MKSARRHELQHNTLSDSLGAFIEQYRPYMPAVLGVIVAIILGFGGYLYLNQRQNNKAGEAWAGFLAASRDNDAKKWADVSEAYTGQAAGMWAQFMGGTDKMERGLSMLYRDKKEALSLLKDAQEAFHQVEDEADRIPLLKQRATLCRARALESLAVLSDKQADREQNVDLAKAAYRRLLEQPGSEPVVLDAARAGKQRLEQFSGKAWKPDVNTETDANFLSWLAQQEFRPPTQSGAGGLGGTGLGGGGLGDGGLGSGGLGSGTPFPNVDPLGTGGSGTPSILPKSPLDMTPKAESDTFPGSILPEVGSSKPKAETPKPGSSKPDAGKPDTGKPDAGKPDAGKPDTSKAPEATKSKPAKKG